MPEGGVRPFRPRVAAEPPTQRMRDRTAVELRLGVVVAATVWRIRSEHPVAGEWRPAILTAPGAHLAAVPGVAGALGRQLVDDSCEESTLTPVRRLGIRHRLEVWLRFGRPAEDSGASG